MPKDQSSANITYHVFDLKSQARHTKTLQHVSI